MFSVALLTFPHELEMFFQSSALVAMPLLQVAQSVVASATLLQHRRQIQLEFLHKVFGSEKVHALDLKWFVAEAVFDGIQVAEEVLIAAVSFHNLIEHCSGEVVHAQSS